jgi:O-antigen/teichoic acid export membrane protein
MNEEKVIDPEASLRKRYLFKLITNLVGMGIGIGTQSIVPRALGPSSYGDFSFITNFFYQVIGFLNMNTSTAYYTVLSQRQHDTGLVRFYLYFTAILGVFLSMLITFCFVAGLSPIIWPGQTGLVIIFGAIWAIMTFYMMVFSDMSDAYGLTVKSELVKIVIKILGFTLILVLFIQEWFSLQNYFFYHFIILLMTISLLVWVISNSGPSLINHWRLKKDQIKSYIHEFYAFSGPLVVFSALAVFEGLLDRWFLQKYSGSAQQGFYGLAYQIGVLCFFFTSALVPLMTREYAISFAKKDMGEMRRLFSRFVPMLYAITAYFGCFLAVESKTVMLLFAGKAYTGAVLPIAIMCFFPIHQTYGQMNASIYFATNRTIAYRNIGIALIFVSLPLTLVLLGPKEYGAMQAGATGLAIKMVLIQLIGVNVQLWYNTKMMHLPFKKFFNHQWIVITAFLSIAIVCSYSIRALLAEMHFVAQFLATGFIYTLVIVGLAIIFPSLFAVRKDEIALVLNYVGITK